MAYELISFAFLMPIGYYLNLGCLFTSKDTFKTAWNKVVILWEDKYEIKVVNA